MFNRFFLNICGPHVNAGWNIGWVFNNQGNGTWAHQSYSAKDFEYTGDTILNYKGYIDKSNKSNKSNITDPTLVYLKNCVYSNILNGSNEKIKVSNKVPIYTSSSS